MLGFIVPIKGRLVSRDWDLDNQLLERTIRSICGQTDQNFKLIIVHNDLPSISISHPNIVYTHFPFELLDSAEIEDFESYVSKYYAKDYAEKMHDKGKKIIFGCKAAIDMGCDYLMAIDSDDLISNKIAAFVNERISLQKAGWRITKGFVYQDNAKYLIRKFDIQYLNGSTHIIRKDLVHIPDFSSKIFWDFNLFECHGYTYGRIKDFHHEVLEDYPYYAVVYIVHTNNYSPIREKTRKLTVRNFAKTFLHSIMLSTKFREEFGLYKI